MVVSEQTTEYAKVYWPLVGISVGVAATFLSVTIVLWALLLIADIP
jgi:hypothetical protein